MSFRVEAPEGAPIASLGYRRAARGGGAEYSELPVYVGHCSRLGHATECVAGLILTSDLQGVVTDPETGANRLLGLAVPEFLEELGDRRAIPRAERLGVLLAGDLFTPLSGRERGGYGPVTAVWNAFAERFAWVAGVAGNHDDCGHLSEDPSVGFLDGSTIEIPESRFVIGGVGRVAGAAERRGRRPWEAQQAHLRSIVDACDLLVLHEGPADDANGDGNPKILEKIQGGRPALIHCGHTPWPAPGVGKIGENQTVINTEGRVVILVADL